MLWIKEFDQFNQSSSFGLLKNIQNSCCYPLLHCNIKFILNFQQFFSEMAHLHYLATEIVTARSTADTAGSPAARDTGHQAAARVGTAAALVAAGGTPLHSLSLGRDLPLPEKRSCAPRCQQGRRNNLERGSLGLHFYKRDFLGFHLPPLRFHCVGGCWDRTQDSCDFGIGCQTL